MKISLRAKASVPKTHVKRKLPLHSLYLPHNTLMLTESRGEFSDLHFIFRLRALGYSDRVLNLVHLSLFDRLVLNSLIAFVNSGTDLVNPVGVLHLEKSCTVRK